MSDEHAAEMIVDTSPITPMSDASESAREQEAFVDSLVSEAKAEISEFAKSVSTAGMGEDDTPEGDFLDPIELLPNKVNHGEVKLNEESGCDSSVQSEPNDANAAAQTNLAEAVTMRLRDFSNSTIQAAQKGWKDVIDTAQPHIDQVKEKVQKEGLLAATQSVVDSTFQAVKQGTQQAAVSTAAYSKPYVERLLENPQIDRVVGGIRQASVGVGGMAVTIASATREQVVVAMRQKDPTKSLEQVELEEAWNAVIESGGNELVVPARDELTTQFVVPKGSILQWQFRVEKYDIGFAVRLRMQGDGGASECDVFPSQRYPTGVTVRGEWSPQNDAVLVVVWDNKYSLLRQKTIVFEASVKPMEGAVDESLAPALPSSSVRAHEATLSTADTTDQPREPNVEEDAEPAAAAAGLSSPQGQDQAKPAADAPPQKDQEPASTSESPPHKDQDAAEPAAGASLSPQKDQDTAEPAAGESPPKKDQDPAEPASGESPPQKDQDAAEPAAGASPPRSPPH